MKGAGILFWFREVRCRFWYRKNPIDSRKKGRTTLRCILYRNYNLYSAYLAILSGALLGSRKRWSPSWLVSFRRFPPFSHWIPLGAIHGSSKRYCCSALKLLYQHFYFKRPILNCQTPLRPLHGRLLHECDRDACQKIGLKPGAPNDSVLINTFKKIDFVIGYPETFRSLEMHSKRR